MSNGNIIISPSNNWPFTDTIINDFIIFPDSNIQRIQFGTCNQFPAVMTLTSNNGLFKGTFDATTLRQNGINVLTTAGGTLTGSLTGTTINATTAIETAGTTRITNTGALQNVSLNASSITGTLGIANGGTGATSFTSGQILIGAGTSALTTSANLTWNSTTNTLSATNVSGNGSALTSLNATNLSSGTVSTARLPTASTTASGIVQLDDTVSSTSTTLAATANAVKAANDNANGRIQSGGNGSLNYLAVTGYVNIAVGAIGFLNGNGQVGPGGNFTAAYSINCSHRVLANEFNANSDRRIKDEIQDFKNDICYNLVKNLQQKHYRKKDDNSYKIGFIAQEVADVVPNAVTIVEKTIDNVTYNDFHVLDHNQLSSVLWGAVRHLMTKVESLEAEISLLKGQ